MDPSCRTATPNNNLAHQSSPIEEDVKRRVQTFFRSGKNMHTFLNDIQEIFEDLRKDLPTQNMQPYETQIEFLVKEVQVLNNEKQSIFQKSSQQTKDIERKDKSILELKVKLQSCQKDVVIQKRISNFFDKQHNEHEEIIQKQKKDLEDSKSETLNVLRKSAKRKRTIEQQQEEIKSIKSAKRRKILKFKKQLKKLQEN